MSKFSTFLSASASAQFYGFNSQIQMRLKKSFQSLKQNPFSNRSGADIKKLKGNHNPPLYRLRVGDVRIIYFIITHDVKITQIIKRKEGYKFLD